MIETVAQLEGRLRARLRPLDGAAGEPGASDFDLNPGFRTSSQPLVDAAVLVGILIGRETPAVLLTRRTDTLTKHAGQVAFPGGRCDPGETAVQAALREAEEEVGLDRRFVRPLGMGDAYETVTGYRIAPVVAVVDDGFTLAAAPEEVADVFETPWSWLMDPANAELRDREFQGQRRRFYAYAWEGRTIWGATAGMLNGLRRRLYG